MFYVRVFFGFKRKSVLVRTVIHNDFFFSKGYRACGIDKKCGEKHDEEQARACLISLILDYELRGFHAQGMYNNLIPGEDIILNICFLLILS